jgi:hypothetical protein
MSELAAPRTEGQSPRRLIVAVSEADWDDTEWAGRIWRLAEPQGSPVFLLGLYREEGEQLQVRRQLATLAAAIRDSRVSAQIHVRSGNDWVALVRELWQPGDLVVCSMQRPGGRGPQPATQLLSSGLQLPLHVLTTGRPAEAVRPRLLTQLVSWGGALGIIAAFLWLQIGLSQPPGGAGQTALLALTVLAEVGLLWTWNAITS